MTIKNHMQAVEYIHSFTRFGSQLNLDRMTALLKLMDNPQKHLKFIHVAGTNGKGSTTQMCTNILINAGYIVGTFTSPYIFEFRERFKVNNSMIDKKEFVDIVNYVDRYVYELSEKDIHITEFEMVTAVGLEFFKRKQCDIVCLEVGLGGQFDATNIINTPLVAIITSISMDHMSILGDTIEKISTEKAGIIKHNTDVVVIPNQDQRAIDVIVEKCKKTNSILHLHNNDEVHLLESDFTGNRFSYLDKSYYTNLVGEHQINNAVAVIKAMEILNNKGFHIQVTDIRCGLATVTMPGRFHVVSKNPYIILDGAHNTAAIAALGKTISKLPHSKKIVLMGTLKDKEYEQTIKEICNHCDVFIAIPIPGPRSLEIKKIADIAKLYCNEVYAIDNYITAINKAIEISQGEAAIIVCGSFFLVGDFNTALKKRNRLR